MKRKDVKILVVNRSIFPDEEDYGGLDNHIKTLIAYGYSVTETNLPPNNMLGYDIIVAHPPRGFLEGLAKFHREHPEIPLVLDSGYIKGTESSHYERYARDKDGVYYPRAATMQDFLRLIKGLTSEIYLSKRF